ncbi:MAG TPA: glycoside hydrolase family 27 protein [Chitinophagaceae bacterium]|nr:glycoside hydrolase family 27 protein [Chitinophagaceae bacterium]
MKKICLFFALLCGGYFVSAQDLAPTPPMGFMTWNYFSTDISAPALKEVVDSMVATGMVEAGYDYIFIDDGWQGGRDNKNNIIPDPEKFPRGMKAFVDYVHSKGVKVGIYSDAAPLTCAGYTASLHFEDQDAKTFAQWGIDYLKYDYCGAPTDRATAEKRYKKMADALRNSGRDIVFAACEWGGRKPWLWAAQAGAQLWRTTGDVRDKWSKKTPDEKGESIMSILDRNGGLDQYAGPGHWNDPDMLVVGLYGKDGPSGDLGGVGCTDVEYQSQMSLWCLMAAPLMVTCDVRDMNAPTKRILLNKDILAIDQDTLGKQAKRVIDNEVWSVFVKPLSGGDVAVGVLNKSDNSKDFKMKLNDLGLEGAYSSFNVWTKEKDKHIRKIKTTIASHQTKVWRLSK